MKLTIEQYGTVLRAVVTGKPVPTPLPREASLAIGSVMQADVRERFQTSTDPDGRPWRPLRRPRPQGGTKPLLNTGQLRNSIVPVVTADGGAVGTNHVAARLHNGGGTIRPKKGKALAIPLTREAVRAGSPRRFKRRLVLLAGKRQGGPAKLVEWKGGKAVAHFLLVKKVVVPARRFAGLSARGRAAVGAVVGELAAKNWLLPLAGGGGASTGMTRA